MQGISNAKHQHLLDALLQLEGLLNGDSDRDTDKQTAAEFRQQLVDIHNSYETHLRELSTVIIDYHDLYNKAKIGFLSPKLKELKRQALCDTGVSPYVDHNIRLLYGT